MSPTLLLLLFSAISASGQVKKQTRADEDYLLPTTVKPSQYNLTLTLAQDVFDTDVFSGELIVTFEVLQATQSIVLHANGLNISSASLAQTQVTITNTDFISDPETDKLEIKTSSNLTPGSTYELYFNYTGTLRSDMYGFYKSSYEEGDVTKYLATTQFQATHARKAFPCFDEPAFKARFKIKIAHSSDLTALSNVPVVDLVPDPSSNISTTTFDITPTMSTYLVAFIISEFTCTQGKSLRGNLPYQVCSRKESEDTRGYALDFGPKIMQALEDFTGIQYSDSGIGKMDQVAIPDFAAGAMENWGLVTYRERGLLYNAKESANSFRQSIALVQAHEFAHMWFGDLVTMKWWSDAFLNEGWARFLQYVVANDVEKTWELDYQFVVSSLQGIMQSDAVESAMALSSPAFTPTQVSSKFGSITYDKGASILRMVQHVMGLDNFKTAVHEYLTKFTSQNTEPNDLWDTFHPYSVEGNLPANTQLREVMLNWVNKSGFPILTVYRNGDNIVITQERFLISGNSSDDDKWYVPISLTKSSDLSKFTRTTPDYWLLPNENLTLSDMVSNDSDNWIIINNQQTGYYRVNYADELWNRIAAAVKRDNFDGIHVLNRAQIVDDLFNLAKVDRLTYSRIFGLVEFLSNDLSYYSWYSAFQAVSHMWQRTSNLQIRNDLSRHFLGLMRNFLNSVSFDISQDDDHIYTLKRVLALTWACRFEDAACIDKSLESFKSYRDSNTKPNKNLRSIVYCTALSNSKDIKADWNFLWQKYSEENLQTEKVTILTSLGCTSDTPTLTEYLNKSINASSGVKPQDALSVFTAVYSGSLDGVNIALDFLIDNHQAIVANYGSMNSLNNMISGLSARFTEEAQITKLEEFAKTSGVDDDLINSVENAIVSARANFEWTKKFEEQLNEYYKNDRGSGSAAAVHIVTILLSIFLYLIV